jgi:hypothetical protein
MSATYAAETAYPYGGLKLIYGFNGVLTTVNPKLISLLLKVIDCYSIWLYMMDFNIYVEPCNTPPCYLQTFTRNPEFLSECHICRRNCLPWGSNYRLVSGGLKFIHGFNGVLTNRWYLEDLNAFVVLNGF